MKGSPDRSRRAFLTGGLARPAPRPSAAPLGPSPPWLAGRISTDTCGACAQPCVPACPEAMIALHPEDHDLAGKAFLDFEAGACTFCRACLEACPEAPADPPGGRALPAVAVDSARCLATRGVVCVICVARCPERALAGGAGGQISVDTGRCSGCGACVAACPTDALEIAAAEHHRDVRPSADRPGSGA